MIDRHRSNQHTPKFGEASRFHEMAWPFMADLGFVLTKDPGSILDSYQLTAATYKTKRGFFLTVGFDPADSNSAMISCGRQWLAQRGEFFCLSNRYSAVARRIGVEAPEYYELGYGDEIARTMERILGDLKKTLPIVLHRVKLDHLLSVEHEDGGAHSLAAAQYGPRYLD